MRFTISVLIFGRGAKATLAPVQLEHSSTHEFSHYSLMCKPNVKIHMTAVEFSVPSSFTEVGIQVEVKEYRKAPYPERLDKVDHILRIVVPWAHPASIDDDGIGTVI